MLAHILLEIPSIQYSTSSLYRDQSITIKRRTGNHVFSIRYVGKLENFIKNNFVYLLSSYFFYVPTLNVFKECVATNISSSMHFFPKLNIYKISCLPHGKHGFPETGTWLVPKPGTDLKHLSLF